VLYFKGGFMSVSVIAFVGMAAVVTFVFAASIIIEFKLKRPKSPKTGSATPQEQGHPASLLEYPLMQPDQRLSSTHEPQV
jgi:hypothetical protein